MFTAKSQECFLRGYKDVEPGTFNGKNGEEIPFDGFHQVTLSFFDKNSQLVDIKCRIPNSLEGDSLYKKICSVPLMSVLLVDLEIQVNKSGNAKYFVTSAELA